MWSGSSTELDRSTVTRGERDHRLDGDPAISGKARVTITKPREEKRTPMSIPSTLPSGATCPRSPPLWRRCHLRPHGSLDPGLRCRLRSAAGPGSRDRCRPAGRSAGRPGSSSAAPIRPRSRSGADLPREGVAVREGLGEARGKTGSWVPSCGRDDPFRNARSGASPSARVAPERGGPGRSPSASATRSAPSSRPAEPGRRGRRTRGSHRTETPSPSSRRPPSDRRRQGP